MSYRSLYLNTDASGNIIQAEEAVILADSTGTPKWSPQTIVTATGSPLSLVSPSGVESITLYSNVDAVISPDASAGGLGNTTSHGQYLLANQKITLPIKAGQTISILASTSGGKIHYNYNMLSYTNKSVSDEEGTIYYVDQTNGSDSYNGLYPAFISGVDGPLKTLFTGVRKLRNKPGDTIALKCGEVWRNDYLQIDESGKAGKPITITSYGTGDKPLLTGGTLVTGWTNVSGNIYKATLTMVDPGPYRCWWGYPSRQELTINEGAYATLALNEFDHFANELYVNIGMDPTGETIEATFTASLILVNGSYHEYRNLKLIMSNSSALLQYDYDIEGGGVYDCDFEKTAMAGVSCGRYSSGIYAWDNVIVRSCYFYDCGRPTFGHAIYIRWADDWIIENCQFVGTAAFAFTIKDCNRIIMRYNYAKDNVGGFCELAQASVAGNRGTKDCSIYYNYSCGTTKRFVYSNSDGSNYDNSGNMVYNNVSYQHTYGAINMDDPIVDLILKNNIFWSTAGRGIRLEATASNLSASDYNCIGPEGTPYIRFQGNEFTVLSAYTASSGFDSHSIVTNPLFVDAGAEYFALQGTSPCIDKGIDVGLTRDFVGNPVPDISIPDIGAYEYKK